MSFVRGLQCKECGTLYPVEARTLCPEDFAPLEVAYDYESMRGRVTRESIEAGPWSLWRYRDLLPIEGEPRAGLSSGMTPLVRPIGSPPSSVSPSSTSRTTARTTRRSATRTVWSPWP